MTRLAATRLTGIVTALLMMLPPLGLSQANAASEIKVVVNQQAITSVDISRRVNFLRLQRTKGNHSKMARDQLVEEALKMQEARRVGAIIGEAQVDAAFANFAKQNNLNTKQMGQILAQSGVTTKHFKDFIRVEMTWPRLVQARYGAAGGTQSTQDLVSKMLESGGTKPKTTEYILQQVIFVVPEAKRSKSMLGARQREAEQLRTRFPGCDGSKQTAVALRDVTIRDLGRVLQPQLPSEWKPFIEKTKQGGTTQSRVTPRGIEFIAVCSAKTVSDDMAAAMVFQAENDNGNGDSDNAKDFLKELREKAVISDR